LYFILVKGNTLFNNACNGMGGGGSENGEDEFN